MNKVFLMGNLTRDPELTETASGKTICRASIAVNRDFTEADGERGVDYFNLTIFGQKGETIAKYFSKGKKILVLGWIKTGNYEDSNGNKRKSTDIMVKEFWFTQPSGSSSRDDRDDYESSRGSSNRRPDIPDDDSDIPF